jgi:hypothetical protein
MHCCAERPCAVEEYKALEQAEGKRGDGDPIFTHATRSMRSEVAAISRTIAWTGSRDLQRLAMGLGCDADLKYERQT